MTLQVRRVVTGHDERGRSVVTIDEIAPVIQGSSEKTVFSNVWSTVGFPADNADDEGADRSVGLDQPDGTVFRVLRVLPGNPGMVHSTQTIDYAVVISGSITMELEDGVEVLLSAGDVLVQRGTVHNWQNRGTEPCVLATILIAATPLG